MIDSRTAAHKAVFTALNGTATVTALADVWSHPEEDTEPTKSKGLVLVGLASCTNEGGKDGGFDEVTIDVLTYTRTPEVTDLYAASSAVRNALEAQAITATGALISPPEFVSAESDLMEDGETYFDTQRFRMFVQAA
jgi:hypothetical protein